MAKNSKGKTKSFKSRLAGFAGKGWNKAKKAAKEASGFTVLGDGTYLGKIVKMIVGTSSNGNFGLKVQVTVVKGPDKGANYFHWQGISEDEHDLSKIAKLMNQLGVDDPDIENLEEDCKEIVDNDTHIRFRLNTSPATDEYDERQWFNVLKLVDAPDEDDEDEEDDDTSSDDDEGDDEDEKPSKSKSKKSKSKDDDDDEDDDSSDDDDSDDDDDEDEKPSKSKSKKSKDDDEDEDDESEDDDAVGFKKGDRVSAVVDGDTFEGEITSLPPNATSAFVTFDDGDETQVKLKNLTLLKKSKKSKSKIEDGDEEEASFEKGQEVSYVHPDTEKKTVGEVVSFKNGTLVVKTKGKKVEIEDVEEAKVKLLASVDDDE